MIATVELHRSIETLPIGTFYKIVDTGDYSLLGEGGSAQIWTVIYDEYYAAAGLKMPEWKDLVNLQNMIIKHEYIALLLEILKKKDKNYEDCVKTLRAWGYRMNPSKDFQANVDRFYSNLEVLATKIEMLKGEFPEEIKKDFNIWREVVILKKHFKFDIDPNKTTCREWIELRKQYAEDVRSR